MNKYQRQRSKEIKRLMAENKRLVLAGIGYPYEMFNYTQARRRWNGILRTAKRQKWDRPCNSYRNKPCNNTTFKIIAYCSMFG